VQQSLQPKLSRRRYASVSYALQRQLWWITNRQWQWIPVCWTRSSKTSLAVSRI